VEVSYELKESNALRQATEMFTFENKREFSGFVDYLLPAYYNNELIFKGKLAEIFSRMSNLSHQ
jgi:hypothetical protein